NKPSLQTPNPFYLMQDSIIFKIAKMKTDETASFLVSLMHDRNYRYLGGAEGALNIGHAITVCGKPCLPYLKRVEEVSSRKRFADKLIDYIEQGKLYGP
ncbi:MAG: hypothetical protein KAI63_01900, partial [Planctomycetes bacterium]|nr:hypothetical protein [Planctomycetota bacterium]